MNFRKNVSDYDSAINAASKKLKFLSGEEYGSVCGFFLKKEARDYIRHHNDEKNYIIDSLIAYDRENELCCFYIGTKATISSMKDGFIIETNRKKDNKIASEEFFGSNLYLTVNDDVLRDSNDILLPEIKISNQKEHRIRQMHSLYFKEFSRKHGLWYLDNAGSYNVIIHQE